MLLDERETLAEQYAVHDVHRLGDCIATVRIAVSEGPRRIRIDLQAQFSLGGQPLENFLPRGRVENNGQPVCWADHIGLWFCSHI